MNRMLLLLVLISAGSIGCRCGERTPDASVDAENPDADQRDGDVEADRDQDRDDDRDNEADDGGARDADQDDADLDEPWRPETGTLEELCADAGPAWTWSPFECPAAPDPDDCCPSCRRLTCREVAVPSDIWGDLVAYWAGTSVGVVNLATGLDEIVFASHEDEGVTFSYGKPAITSRYAVAWRTERIERTTRRRAIVARRLSDLTGQEIVLDDSENQLYVEGVEADEEWALWARRPPSTGYYEIVLHNIETGEQRILDQDRWDYSTLHADIWGDRVVWGASGGLLREHRISTGVTRNVLERPELEPMFGTSVWEHYAVYNREVSGEPLSIWLVDLDTADVQQLTPPGVSQTEGSIQGGRIVWTDYGRSDPHTPRGMHIYVYSMRTGREYVLNPSSTASSGPMIFGQYVVWGALWNGISSRWVTRIGNI